MRNENVSAQPPQVLSACNRELAPRGISVSLLQPGRVRTEMCNRAACGEKVPRDTTTPAIHHALTSPRPKARYAVSHVMPGVPAWVFQTAFPLLPDRIADSLIEALW